MIKISQITEEELSSIPKSDTDLMEEAVRSNEQTAIKRLQQILLSFPWKELGYAKPNISINGKIDDPTASAINWLSQIGDEIDESSLSKMKDFVSNNDYFNAQSMAYVGKQALVNALNQPQNLPKELLDKYPGLRRWTQEEMMEYLKNTSYPGYFPKPWSVSRLGKRDWAGKWNCEGDQCQKSYYESFMSWGPNKQGIELIYDPRLSRNMDKYPNIWSSRAIKYRAQNNIPSPHIPSPGVGERLDVNNLPDGKQFMDEEDKSWYFQLLRLYDQFVKEERERGTSYIAPPDKTIEASLIVDDFYSLAAEKDAKELMKINLSQIPKGIQQDQDPKEFYQLLNEQAKDGPIFNRSTIEYVHNLSEAILPKNRKPFVKWLANQHQSGINISNNDIITIKDYLNNVNIDLDKISFPELLELSNNWHTEEFEIQENTGSYKTKDVVYSFDNGYTIVKVPSEDLGTEGSKMGHCVGDYCEAVYSGKKEIYSLRDPKNEPHVTIELSNNPPSVGWRAKQVPTNIIEQIKGKENKPPIEVYSRMVKKWLFDTFKPEQFIFNEDYVASLPFEDILEIVKTTPEDRVDWADVSTNINLTEDFIREYQDRVYWDDISRSQKLSENFIREFQDKVNWVDISRNQKLSLSFVEEFQNKIKFDFFAANPNLTEDIIREFQDKLNWNLISKYQKLSIPFIKENQDKINWSNLSMNTNLTEDIIREFQDKLNWRLILIYQKLSETFKQEFKHKFQKAALFNIVDRFYKISQMIF